MASTTNLNIRIDSLIKEQAEAFFAELGMSLSTAVGVFMRQSLRERKIPFEISLESDPYFNKTNMEVIRQSIAELEAGNVIHKTLEELRAME
jgi:DNA-damage-inducible protein J